MKNVVFRKMVVFTFVFLSITLCGGGHAQPFSFEKDDSLDVLRDKIELNGYDFKVDHNWVFDLPLAEREGLLGRRPPQLDKKIAPSIGIGPLEKHLNKSLPSSFDWRDYGGNSYIGPVRNQGDCGSCYSFGAAAAAEGTFNLSRNLFGPNCIDFSEAFIAFCLAEHYEGFGGCDGSDYDYEELDGLTEFGLPLEEAFPYEDREIPCLESAWDADRVIFPSWHRVPCGDIDAIKTAIMTYGVVDAAVDVGSAFSAYSSGIYEDTNTGCEADPCYYTPTNHAISLVGWNDNGDAENNGYWILRNSWGTGWGEEGYMRIRYHAARVACEVAYLVPPPVQGFPIAPENVVSLGVIGRGFEPDYWTITIENDQASEMDWQATQNVAWLQVDPVTGTIPVGATQSVLVSVTATPEQLGIDNHTGRVYFNGTGQASSTLVVTLAVEDYWDIDPNELEWYAVVGEQPEPATQTFMLGNNSDSDLQWQSSSEENWIEWTPTSGTIPADSVASVTVSLSADVTGFATGEYIGSIIVTNMVTAVTNTVWVGILVEEDDAPTVYSLNCGETVYGTLGEEDYDWFEDGTASVLYQVKLQSPLHVSFGLEGLNWPKLVVYNEENLEGCTSPAVLVGEASEENQILNVSGNLPAGTYIVAVNEGWGDPEGSDYSLNLVCQSAGEFTPTPTPVEATATATLSPTWEFTATPTLTETAFATATAVPTETEFATATPTSIIEPTSTTMPEPEATRYNFDDTLVIDSRDVLEMIRRQLANDPVQLFIFSRFWYEDLN